MITKMKKFTFLVYHKDYEEFLYKVRDLGVIHIAEKMQGAAENPDLQERLKLNSRIMATQKFFKKLTSETKENEGDAQRGFRVVEEVEELQNEKARLNQHLQAYAKEKVALEVWGDFDPDNITRLKSSGYDINFYVASESTFKDEWWSDYNAVEINRIGSKIYFITITKTGELPELEVESSKLPTYSLSKLSALYEETEKEIERVDEKLVKLAEENSLSLDEALRQNQSGVEFSKVVLSTDKTAGDKLMLLEGWAPASKVQEIEDYLQTKDAYYEVSNPVPGDNVPVKLNNTGFFRLFEPITKLYMLPQYSELDLTPFFAPFFMIFFGLCLGDSGYGLFLVVLVTLYRMFAKNIGPSMKSILTLVQILGISTFFAGLLSGSFFGFNLYGIDIPFFQKMRDLLYMDNQWMFNLSLILGVIQILFGMIIKVFNQTIQFGFKYAVSTLGWVILLMSTGFAFLLPGIMPMGGTIHIILLCISGIMIFFFNSPDKNIFVNFGLGFWDTYNMATGLLGDILSYVRLFALGLSGGILASVFNSLAAGMSPDNVIMGPIVTILIFVIGHAINIFMNVLGAMVHPMRLTFVEFFKNAGYEGGGKEYRPFKNL